MTIQSAFSSPRAAIMAVFAAFGAAVGTLAGSVPTVLRDAGVDSPTFGLALTISTAATVLAMSLGGAIARIASNRLVLLVGLPVFWLMLAAFLVSATPGWFFAAFFSMGFMFGLVDIFMNAEATAIEHDLRRPVFTAFHGCVSAATAVFAILSSFVSTQWGTGAAALAAGVAFAIAWSLTCLNVAPRQLVRGRAVRIMALPNKTPLVLLGIAAGLIIAGETAALLWSAKLLEDMAPSLAAISGLGAAFFGLCNAMVRLPGDALRARFNEFPLMIGSLAVAMTGFVVLGLSGNFVLSVAAFACIGFGVAILIPCIFTVAVRFVPHNRAGGLGFISLLSGVPRVLAPWFFGWVAGLTSISFAFGLVAIALAVALALIVTLLRARQTEQTA